MSKYSENKPASIHAAIEWMLDDIKPNSTVLDFGCSTGYFGKYLKDNKQCTVYGIEISEDAKEAKKVLDGVYTFDLEGEWDKDVYSRKYDYLFFGDILEHLKDPGETLKRAKELLKPSGTVFVSIPNIAHISIRLELMSGNFEYEPMGILDNTHLKYFTLSSFSKLANKAGYEVERVGYTIDDYPKEIVTKFLEKLGLEGSEKFWALTDKIEARSLQYKFVLKPTTNKKLDDIAKKPTIQKPVQFRDSVLDELKDKVKNLDEHAKKQAEIIEHYVTVNQRLEVETKQLHRIKKSAIFKSAKKLRYAVGRRPHKQKNN